MATQSRGLGRVGETQLLSEQQKYEWSISVSPLFYFTNMYSLCVNDIYVPNFPILFHSFLVNGLMKQNYFTYWPALRQCGCFQSWQTSPRQSFGGRGVDMQCAYSRIFIMTQSRAHTLHDCLDKGKHTSINDLPLPIMSRHDACFCSTLDIA